MKKLKYAVGIDISKDDFKVCISVINEAFQVKVIASSTFKNTAGGIKQFMDWVKKHHKETEIPLFYLMEATGVYHENLAWQLYQHSQNVIIVLANKAKRYLQSLGIKSKNDKIDAQGLAQMCAEKSLQLWQPISKNIYHLRSLTRLHEDLQVQKNGFNNRLKALGFGMYEAKEAIKAIKKLISELTKQIEVIENNIQEMIKKDPVLSKKYDAVTSIKGVGLMAFAVLIAETDGFSLVKNVRQLTSYAGYDIVENQSGQKVGRTRISKRGNSHIRRVLHLPAFNTVKYEKTFKDLYERVYDRTGIKMKGYVAVQRKLLCLMYTLWKKEENFNPQQINPVELSEAKGKLSFSV